LLLYRIIIYPITEIWAERFFYFKKQKMIKARVIADSKDEKENRLTTIIGVLPRIVLAELNTHRMFSRNSASSRAIPFKKMVKMVEEDPFIPIAWQADHKGMQGTEYLTDLDDILGQTDSWLKARNEVIHYATELNIDGGVTKQLCNRLLEPFMWHTVIITASEWENFFQLRCPQYEDPSGNLFRSKKDYINNSKWDGCKDWDLLGWLGCNRSQAEIHIQAFAEAVWDAMNESKPKQLKGGDWHIPFGNNMDEHKLAQVHKSDHPPFTDAKIKIATARCARLSYHNYKGKDDYAADLALYDRLASMQHWSPFEHVAKCMNTYEFASYQRCVPAASGFSHIGHKGWCKNFRGFIQQREIQENENRQIS
jgi:hypothetical protein